MDILVVEDDPLMRGLLSAILENQKWQVRTAENGRSGLNRLFEKKPDIIVLDLMMPVMDGFEFLDILRNQAAWQSIPVVVMTAMELTKREHQRLDGRIDRLYEKGDSNALASLVPAIQEITSANSS